MVSVTEDAAYRWGGWPHGRVLAAVIPVFLMAFLAAGAVKPAATPKPPAAPQFTQAVLRPSVVASAGGRVSVRVRVQNAQSCWFVGVPGVLVPASRQNCAQGLATTVADVKPIDSTQLGHLHVTAYAENSKGAETPVSLYFIQEGLGQLEVVTQSLVGAAVNKPYKYHLAAQGGRAPYAWHLTGGTMPLGLSLSPSGTIYGTPRQPRSSSLGFEVVDSARPTPFNASVTIALSVAPAPLRIVTGPLPGGATQSLYNAQFNSTGGVTPYSWKWLSGQLPPGLTLSPTGTLSGTPTGGGTYKFQVQVSDSASSPQVTTRSFSVVVVTPPLGIGSVTLPGATVGSDFSVQLLAHGGVPPYTWGVGSGPLPSGVTLSNSGLLSGTPTIAGTYKVTIKVTDSSATPLTAHASYKLVVSAVPLSVTTLTVPGGTVGSPYAMTLSATGGTTPYYWTIAGGLLPDGIQLSAGGALSGTPDQAGTFHFSVAATDSSPKPLSATINYTMVIAPVALLVTTTGLPAASLNNPYAAALATSGGTSPFNWTVTSGKLPPGIVMSSAGYLTGITSTPGAFKFAVRVTDSSPTIQTATTTLTLLVGNGARNWSGYVATGSYTEVAGTFGVASGVGPPQKQTCQGASCPSTVEVAQFVGLDGVNSTAANGTAAIEAGVTVTQNGSASAWWQVAPGPQVPMAMTVNPGDKITVTIFEAGTNLWAITLDDDSTGEDFRTEQTYSGPAAYADFVVEAPLDTSITPPVMNPLASFSPPVDFTNLSKIGDTTSTAALVLVQGDVQVATPSIKRPAGFAVAYGSIAPSPPV